MIKKFAPNACLVVIDVHRKDKGIPTNAYVAVEEIHDDGTETTKTFSHISSDIRAEEAEEIGVEHLLRDVKDNALGTLSTRIDNNLDSLKSLSSHLTGISNYLMEVVDGKLPINHPIIYNLQSMFNLLPNLDISEVVKSFSIKTNDQLLVVYLSSLCRAVIALHNLINNKLQNRNDEINLLEAESPKTEEKPGK